MNFAKGTARLFVAQNILKAKNVARKFGNVVLRFVDRLQSLLQLSEALGSAPRRALKVLIHSSAHLRQSLLHQLQHIGLGRGLRFRDVIEAASKLLLPVRN